MEKLNKYKRWNTQLHLFNDMYWDFVLSQDTTPYKSMNGEALSKDDCLSAFIDFSRAECIKGDTILSLPESTWSGAVSEIVTLQDYGFTAIDNGRVKFDNIISNKEYYDLITNSPLELEGDKRLCLYKADGNTYTYSYPMEYNEDGGYYTLKGGFFQGFYKLFGFDYQVLPQYIENGWNVEFVLRPRDIVESPKTLNSKNDNRNKGIFFFMGTRAENKFAEYYDSDIDTYPKRKEIGECGDDYFAFDWDEDEAEEQRYKAELIAFMLLSPFNCSCKTPCASCRSYSNDDKYKEIVHDCEMYFSDDYLTKEEEMKKNIKTSDGALMERGGYKEIETDNKFLTFDRTRHGFTVDTFKNEIVKLYQYIDNSNENKFLTYHRGKGGKTADTETVTPFKYDVEKDIDGNVFALRLTEDGAIEYRYMVKDCDEGYKILTESSLPGIVANGIWSVVNIKFEIINGNTDDCGIPMGERKMRILFYVNGRLVFVSKELPEFKFRELDEIYAKQEGVPFNISVGGGTQGLCEAWQIDERRPFNRILPLEENFAGTFIGDIKSFKFYTCPLTYPEIRNNYLFEKQRL